MLYRLLPRLIDLAATSTMGSRHAAAIVSGNRVLSTGVNRHLPAGELMSFARSIKGGEEGDDLCDQGNNRVLREEESTARIGSRDFERCARCSIEAQKYEKVVSIETIY